MELYSYSDKVVEEKRHILEFLIGLKREGKGVVGYGAPAKATRCSTIAEWALTSL